MEIRHYFESAVFSPGKDKNSYSVVNPIGKTIENFSRSPKSDNLQKVNIAIIGVPSIVESHPSGIQNSSDIIRNELYKLSEIRTDKGIADLGNLKPAKSKKGTYLALRDIIEYLNDSDIVAIILGGNEDLNLGVCKAFTNFPYFTFSTIDSFLNVKKEKETLSSSNYLTQLFSDFPHIFQFNLLAYQSYFVSDGLFKKTKGITENIRLGLLRENIRVAEPALRNTNVLSFDLGAIRYGDSQGSNNFSPNGLRSDEACQLANFAGLSNHMKVFGLYDSNFNNDRNGITAKLSAQIIWHFMEGVSYRQIAENQNHKNYETYKVEIKNLDRPLVFMKDIQTDQWWIEITAYNGRKLKRACSESDYIHAKRDEIPDIWLKNIQKMDEY